MELKPDFNHVIISAFVLALAMQISSQAFGDSQVVYSWTSVDFDWPSSNAQNESLWNGSFVPERNIIAGIKIYKGQAYVTIPRWRWNSGQPATLLKVVETDGVPRLRPYPSWEAQTLGDCKALQYVQSMEIDPNTGLMYAIDTGRTGIIGEVTPNNLCPAKVVVYDLNNDSMVDTYEFPTSVVPWDNNFINDIVLDYVNGTVRFAYITDVIEGKIYVLDFQTRLSYALEDKSMKAEGGNATIVTINGKDYFFGAAVDGIAMSPDFKYILYCPLGGYNLYQIPTSALRNLANSHPFDATEIRYVGRKVSQTDGMAFSNKKLYYGAMGLNALYFWDISKDEKKQGVGEGQAELQTQTLIIENNRTMQWIDTFGFDDQGWLWFTSNRLHLFMDGSMDFTGADGINMNIWRVFINETGYLFDAKGHQKKNMGDDGNQDRGNTSLVACLITVWFCLCFSAN